jgi:hypothetical protein
MWLRFIAGVGLLALGYYVGKQVGRMEPIRDELARARAAAGDETAGETGASSE